MQIYCIYNFNTEYGAHYDFAYIEASSSTTAVAILEEAIKTAIEKDEDLGSIDFGINPLPKDKWKVYEVTRPFLSVIRGGCC